MNRSIRNPGEFFAVHAVLFLTGFTFLVYEVSWNRLLSLVLGATVTASTIVLSSFMAGFGAGAYVWGRVAVRSRRIGSLLSLLLIGIGLFSLLDYQLFMRVVPRLYPALSGAGVPGPLVETIVFLSCAFLLFLPSFLMGGIFPVLSGIAVRSERSISSTLGRLYAVETFGGVIGGLVTGFLLLGALGQRNTIALAVALNLLPAIALFFTRGFRTDEHDAKDAPPVEREKKRDTSSRYDRTSGFPARRRAALAGTFVCGFSILSLQLFWLRIFQVYLTNTSYTFALVSSIAVLGLFTGGVLFKQRGYRIRDHTLSLVRALAGLGVTAAAGLVLLVYFPQLVLFPFQSVLGNPIARVFLLPFATALVVVFPPAMFSGYAFPLACRMYTVDKDSVSRDVGLVLMMNTVGSVLGPLVAAFLMIPAIGAAAAIPLIVLLLAGSALFIMYSREGPGRRQLTRMIAVATVAIGAIYTLAGPCIRILPPSFARFDREVLFYRESVEGTLSVGQERNAEDGTKQTFVNNSAVIGSTYDAIKVVKMVGHTPFFLGLDCRDVLVIGFGIGVTTSAIASHEEVESIECVELVEGLKDAAVFYRDLNRDIVDDPRLKIIGGDGRHYLQRTTKRYDLISCDPTHPILGSGNLYTVEYFELCREHLNPGGMVAQYLPLHKLRPADFLGLIRTFHSVFPECTVWLGHYHAVLLGSTEAIRISYDEWAKNIAAVEKDPYFYTDPHHLAVSLMLDGPTIEQYIPEIKINSDDRSYTEFFAPGCLDEKNIGRNLEFFLRHRTDFGRVIRKIPDPGKMARFAEGNRLLTEALFYKLNGDEKQSLETLRRACRVNPEDQEYPFLIRFYYPGG